MTDYFATLAGEIEIWPRKDELARILGSSGLRIYVGRYSIRVEDCEFFSFEQFGGDLGDPIIAADAETVDGLLKDAQLVSNALAAADVRHRFEIYGHDRNLAAYVHHRWPSEA